MHPFFKITLRTTDVEAARAFYKAVLGDHDYEIVQLHEQAVARGATPHWLGFIEVDDVARASAAFIERGATPLAPIWKNPAGLEAAVMRDPGGAVVALGKPPESMRPKSPGVPGVDWILLHTANVDAAVRNYSELFGWHFDPPRDLGEHGTFHMFAFDKGAPPSGSLTDIAGRPQIHPHWRFHFHVESLARALEAARAHNAIVLGPFTLPSGDTIAVLDDPQGASFSVYERHPE